MKVMGSETVTVPFADHPLTAYFPGFDGSLNSTRTTLHVDTGGTFLHMGVERAESFGIALEEAGTGRHGAGEVATFTGTAGSVSIGAVELHDVPVIALPSLSGAQDFVIFGTNLLEAFVTTLDYPASRMLLTPRKSAALARAHMDADAGGAVVVPFTKRGDHYLIAEGGIGSVDHLQFFVDSGLVSLHPGEGGETRQAALVAARADLRAWGVDVAEVSSTGAVELRQPLRLGMLAQTGHLALAPDRGILTEIDGARIDGLISHAFLKRYRLTIDFEGSRFLFGKAGGKP